MKQVKIVLLAIVIIILSSIAFDKICTYFNFIPGLFLTVIMGILAGLAAGNLSEYLLERKDGK